MRDEPYYESVANEIKIFDASYRNQLPMLLKGLPVWQDALCRTVGAELLR